MTKVVLPLCGLFAAAALLSAQTAPAPPDTPSLIRMRLVALDSSGQPASDVTASDLRITDQGKQQKLAFFRSAPAPAAPDSPSPARATAIIFDLMNQNRADRTNAAKRLAKSLQQVELKDPLYLYVLALDGTLHPLHAVPKSPAESFSDDRNWTRQAEKIMDQAMKTLNLASPAGILQEDVVKKTFVALETIATQLSAVPGPRDIVWVTNGIPMVFNPRTTCSGDWIECALYVPHLAVTLQRAGVAVHPLSYASTPTPATTRDIDEMAGLTGGKAWFGEDIKNVLDGIAEGARASYFVAYDPGADSLDSKFHKVRLTAERKGVRLLYPQRYYAIADQRPAAALEQSALVGAYGSPSDGHAIGVRVVPSRAAGAANTVHLEVRINPADLLFAEQNGQVAAQVTVLFASYTDGGPKGDPAVKTLNLTLTPDQRDKAMKEGIPLPQDYPADGSAQKIRVVVYDRGSRSVGSATVPVPART